MKQYWFDRRIWWNWRHRGVWWGWSEVEEFMWGVPGIAGWHGECRCSELEMVQRQVKNRCSVYSNEEKSQGITAQELALVAGGPKVWKELLSLRTRADSAWAGWLRLEGCSHGILGSLFPFGVPLLNAGIARMRHPWASLVCWWLCQVCAAGPSPAVWGWPGSAALQSSIQHQGGQIHLLGVNESSVLMNYGAAGTWNALQSISDCILSLKLWWMLCVHKAWLHGNTLIICLQSCFGFPLFWK